MKKPVLVVSVILALIAGGTLYCYTQYPRTKQPVPAIAVKIVMEDGWTGTTEFLRSVNGYSSTSNLGLGGNYFGNNGYDENTHYDINASYQVASSSPGHFFVLAHYTIKRNGISTDVDRAIPVQSDYTPSPLAQERLKRATWTNLDNHLCTFAYLSDTKL